MFRSPQGHHHQGGIYKGTEVNQKNSVKDVRDLHIFDRIGRVLYPQDGDNKVERNVANFQSLCHN